MSTFLFGCETSSLLIQDIDTVLFLLSFKIDYPVFLLLADKDQS